MTTTIVVLVTCPSPAQARRLATALVRHRAAACVNILPGVRSVFRWRGAMDEARETLLIIKTPRRQFEPLRRLVRALHPYEVPEIIALPTRGGHAPYLRWVRESVG